MTFCSKIHLWVLDKTCTENLFELFCNEISTGVFCQEHSVRSKVFFHINWTNYFFLIVGMFAQNKNIKKYHSKWFETFKNWASYKKIDLKTYQILNKMSVKILPFLVFFINFLKNKDPANNSGRKWPKKNLWN